MKEVITSRILRTIPSLIAVCLVSIPVHPSQQSCYGELTQAQYGGGSGTTASAETNTYVFLPSQSTVVQTGGIAGVHETYPIEGQFRLTVDFDAGTALFSQVDANLVDESPFLPTESLGELFNMAELLGTVVDDTIIDFVGKTADGMESDILLTLTFRDDSAHLTGRTVPPPNSADFFIFELDAVASKKYGGGTGEPNDPYRIATAEDLMLLGESPEDYDKHFILTADIDLDPNLPGRKVFDRAVIAPDTDSNDTSSGFQGTPFAGVFDGDGHTISHLTITGVSYLGLFGHLGSGAKVSNLVLEAVDVNGTRDCVGGLVGENYSGTITDCYATGTVTGDERVGDLVGGNYWGTITNCYATGSVSGDYNVGGLVGDNFGPITNCYATGNVSGSLVVGGLVGTNERGTISNSYSTGSVLGTNVVGGLVGINWDTITNCYATGSVLGTNEVGGLVGWNARPGPITNCYSAGSVTGTKDVGGLVGDTIGGAVTDSFWDIETSGQSTSAGGTGKTTVEIQMASTFITWGCEPTVWTIDEGVDYPRLAWENKPGDSLPVLSKFLAGFGTQTDPYLIYTAEQFNMIGQFPCEWDKHFKLMTDVDLSGLKGKGFNIIGDWRPFTGVFDGNGKTISNFSYTSTGRNDAGLFGCVDGETAQIKDLGLIAPDVVAGTGNRVGSLVGYARAGNVTGCYAEGARVSGSRYVGGLLGLNEGIITGCYSTGSVSGTVWDVGGLVGWNARPGTITNCYSAGSITGNRDAGGLVGYNECTITNCYSTGSVSGNDGVGGLVGWNWARITNCYSAGRVVGNIWVGGLVGSTITWEGGAVTDSFWDIETSGQVTSDGGTGKTTDEMQMASTFLDAGWDFVDKTENGTEDIWWILEGQDYPRLWWETFRELEN